MKTKRGSKPKEAPETFTVGPEETEFASPEDDPKSNGKTKDRMAFSFDVLEDGSPDLGSMREKTKDRLRQIFNDPKMAEAFGSSRVNQSPPVQIFHPAMVDSIYSLFGAIEALVAMRFFEVPEPIAKRIFTYSPTEKEALADPTLRVMNKYASGWFQKYQDEVALVGLLATFTIAKINACTMMMKMQKAQDVKPENKQESKAENTEPVKENNVM